jgi:hypothetical protein
MLAIQSVYGGVQTKQQHLVALQAFICILWQHKQLQWHTQQLRLLLVQ